jgi:hypothetical protein
MMLSNQEVGMGAIAKRLDGTNLSLNVTVPPGLESGVPEAFEEGVARAMKLFFEADNLRRLNISADKIAELIVGHAQPSVIQIDDLIARKTTIKKILEEGEWLSAEDINRLQSVPPKLKSYPASDWKRRGRVFSVSHDGKDLYPRYQFDALYQPLPVIKDILDAYGQYADAWALAAWFHFPNSWIVKDGTLPLAPKDALDRHDDVVEAARKRRGSYVA